MMKNKKGFVLMEAIVVISVLCIILVVLYGAYSKLLIDVKKKSLYDNTEYIYKTSVIRKYFEEEPTTLDSILGSINLMDSVNIYCSEILDGKNKCNDPAVEGHELFGFLKVKGIYFTEWDVRGVNKNLLEPTTQRYLKTFDVKRVDGTVYRIIVMFQDENDDTGKLYQYATLRIGSRG